MKIALRNFSNSMRLGIEKFRASPPVMSTRTHETNIKFMPWQQGTIGSTRIIDHESVINVVVLEQFLERLRPEEMSYQSLISQALQHGSVEKDAASIKRALTVRKMVALVLKTVADMKMIEIRHIATSKG